MLALILGSGLRLWLYNTVIVDTFYNAPAQLAAAMVGSSDPVSTIDAIWERGGTVAGTLVEQGGRTIQRERSSASTLRVPSLVLDGLAVRLCHVPDCAFEHRLGGVCWPLGPAVRRTAVFRCHPAILRGVDLPTRQLRPDHRADCDGGGSLAANRAIVCHANRGARHCDLDGRCAAHDAGCCAGVADAAPSHAHCSGPGRRRIPQFLRTR